MIVRALLLALTLLLATACRRERPAEDAGSQSWSEPSEQASQPHAVAGDSTRAPLAVLKGKAAYYSDSLRGRPTASGEPYDPGALTAAHRSLPFGTVVRVVRPETGAQVVVRVNDRGPFGDESRILDLSRAAAERLDMLRAGVVRVRAEVLEYGERKAKRKRKR